MAVLTADRNTDQKNVDLKVYPAGVDIIYKGGIVCVNEAGYAVAGADTVNFKVVGVADENVDNSGGSAGDKNVRVRSGRAFRFVATAITQAMLGETMYVVDDQTIDDSEGTNGIVAGILVEFVSTTEGWVFIPAPVNPRVGANQLNLGNIATLTHIAHDDTSPVSILAADADKARTVVIIVSVTEDMGTTPDFDIGETDTTDKFLADIGGGVSEQGESFIAVGTLTAAKAMLCTIADAGAAGEFDVIVLVGA